MTHAAEHSPTGLIRGALNSRFDQALSALASRTAHSWMMALDRSKVLPDASGLPLISLGSAPGSGSVRLFIKSGAGARVTDMDGTSFIDLCLGDGSQILGHAHPVVQQAIVSQSTRGWYFDLPADGQLELARLIQSAGAANERVALCSSGTDALQFAVDAARVFTGKGGTAAFTGCAHGRSEGEQPGAVLPYGHPAALEQIHKRRQELAAVVVEPVRASDPNLERAGWLQSLLQTCREAEVLLIFDERQTGFRLAYGGAQEVFGLEPDLVVYGKAVGGGLPSGAVAGRADVMSTLNHPAASDHLIASRNPAINPLSVTAGTASLSYLLANRSTLYPALNDAGRILAEHLNSFARAERLPVEMRCAGSMFRLSFGAMPPGAPKGTEPVFRPTEAAFNVLVLSRGVMTLPSQRGFISAAHTGTDMDAVREAFSQALIDLRDDGMFGQA